jgi:hypothetical protein
MGPLAPDLLSPELNIFSGLLIGIAFGFVLEQAGFSSSRRLAGVFYAYDFTVLRVFFTAAVTAMGGILLLGRAGLLDIDFIFINPTFVWPAVAGGVIMGAGFITGGYCPGTSICAAAIGKKDALVFVAGGFLGVFLYAEGYPFMEEFVNGTALGPVFVFDSLGIPRGVFAFGLIIAALAAFAVTTVIERRVNPDNAPSRSFPRLAHRAAAAGTLLLGIVLLLLPDRTTAILAGIDDTEYREAHPVQFMTADELAFRIMDRDPRLVIIDLRAAGTPPELPRAVHVPLKGLFAREWQPLLGRRHLDRVFVDRSGQDAVRAALLAERLGYQNARALEGGMENFAAAILDFRPEVELTGPGSADTRRFRMKASAALPEMIREAKAKPAPAAQKIKKVQGGC